MNIPAKLTVGRRGQFDVLVDGKVVLSRKGGLVAKLTGRPWPTDDDLLSALSAARS